MIAISFLGTGDYTETEYRHEGKSFKTEFFPEAVYHIFNPEDLYVILTPQAYNKHYDNLSKRIKFNEININTGKNEDELWDMFNSVVNAIPENSEIIFDVTHGFRSQPLFALAIIIFLKTVKNIKVYKILYGAFEAKTDDITPIFDLTPFLNLIEWTGAVNEFIKYGNANNLRDILSNIQDSHNKSNEDKLTVAKNFGNNLGDFLERLSFLRIHSISKPTLSDLINNLSKSISLIEKDFEKDKSLEPFMSLFSLINSKIEPFGSLTNKIFDIESLKVQVNIVKWYINSNQYQQAFTLYREFLVTSFCIKSSLDPINDRDIAENNIHTFIKKYDFKNSENADIHKNNVHYVIVKYFNDILELRNDMNHASMRENPNPVKSFVNKSKNLIPEMNNIIENYLY